jgi:EAL domain-containing protein (putative c-di-GMP-specific phosphodiesterase class I)
MHADRLVSGSFNKSLARSSGLDPSTLELEITETVAVDDTIANRQTLWALQELGVRLAIDDFGAGNSALNFLRRPGQESRADGDRRRHRDGGAIRAAQSDGL